MNKHLQKPIIKTFLTALIICTSGMAELFSQYIPEGAINGLFSISATEQVYFSKGNLQYKGFAITPYWKFADHQWDYFGDSGQHSYMQNVDRDLFGWGTSGYNHGAICYQPWSINLNSNSYDAYGNPNYNLYDQTGIADWGYNAISNGGNTENTWRTLTKDEWLYVFNQRNTASSFRYALAKVNNVQGVILLPDDWSTSYYSLTNYNSGTSGYTSNVITADQWATLEQHGAVFLPAAGFRHNSVTGDGYYGYYWSSSHYDSTHAYYLGFSGIDLGPDGYVGREYGYSVRLVCPVIDYYEINATPNPEESGVVTGGGVYPMGATCTLTATENDGWIFAGWTENGVTIPANITYSFNVNCNRTLVANFILNSYYIVVMANPSSGGTVSGAGSYDHGSIVTLTATANAGYSFVNWKNNGNIVSTDATYSFIATSSESYIATFSMNSYNVNVTASPTSGGNVSGSGTYNYGEIITLSAMPNENYTFVNWTKNGEIVSTDASYSFMVTENASYIANFERITYQISATTNPENSGIIIGDGSYNPGVTAVLTVIPNDGYVFVNWTKDGIIVSTNTSYSFIVTEAGNYVANLFNTQNIDDIQNNDFMIYPNPANNVVVIESSNTISKLEIYTTLGQLAAVISNYTNKQEIDVSTLSKGVYIIRCVIDGKVCMKKLIIR